MVLCKPQPKRSRPDAVRGQIGRLPSVWGIVGSKCSPPEKPLQAIARCGSQ
jgi:hypothetical protein